MLFLADHAPAGPVLAGDVSREVVKRAADRRRTVLEHQAAEQIRAYMREERAQIVQAVLAARDIGDAAESLEVDLSETLRAVWRSSAERWRAWAAKGMPGVRKYSPDQPRDEAGRWAGEAAVHVGRGGHFEIRTPHVQVKAEFDPRVDPRRVYVSWMGRPGGLVAGMNVVPPHPGEVRAAVRALVAHAEKLGATGVVADVLNKPLAAKLIAMGGEHEGLVDDAGFVTIDLDRLRRVVKDEEEVEAAWLAKDEAPLDAWLRRNAGKQVADISEATRKKLAAQIARGVELGESVAQIARRIDALYLADIIPNRSMVIARTEVGRVINWAQHWQAEDADVEMEKEWLALRDSRTRDDHAEADGQRVPIDEPFEVGDDLMMYPMDESLGAGPENVIGCRCGPGWMLVEASGVLAVTRRFYVGELVEIVTVAGNSLAVTPNHPVLTPHGWVAAGDLHEGSYVVRRAGCERVLGGDPDVDYVPPTIEQVFDALSLVHGRGQRVRSSAVDFHGDGRDGEVDVVLVDDHLSLHNETPGAEHGCELTLASPHRQVSSSRDAATLAGRAHHPQDVRLGDVAGRDIVADEDPTDDLSLPRKRRGDLLLGFARGVSLENFHGDGAVSSNRAVTQDIGLRRGPESYADVGEPAFDGHVPASDLVRDLLKAQTGGVEITKIISVRRYAFSGHVYNLHTRSGWYVAQGVISHNCSVAYHVVAPGERKRLEKYSPDQPRDERGRWTDGGGVDFSRPVREPKPPKPEAAKPKPPKPEAAKPKPPKPEAAEPKPPEPKPGAWAPGGEERMPRTADGSPDYSKMDVLQAQTTLAARTGSKVSIDGMDPVVASRAAQEYDRLARKYPEGVTRRKDFMLVSKTGLSMRDNEWAHSSASGIYMQRKFFNDKIKFQQSLDNSVALQWHPPGCDTVESVVSHEFAHRLDRYLAGEVPGAQIERAGEWRDFVNSNIRDLQAMSLYARVNDKEAVAEAFAQYEEHAAGRYKGPLSPGAAKLGAFLDRLFQRGTA
jgi:hypothetical protein